MDCSQFQPGKRSKCNLCGKIWLNHPHPEIKKPLRLPDFAPVAPTLSNLRPTALEPIKPVEIKKPGPETARFLASYARASNEIMLNEILNLIFPEGKEASGDALTLRLHLVLGVLKKYGFGPENRNA